MRVLKLVPLVLLVFVTACKLDDSVHNPAPYQPQIRTVAELCEIAGGDYTMAFNDCDATRACQYGNRQSCLTQFQQDCRNVGGIFKACASACRNNPNVRACTQQCVPVCKG